MRITSFLFIFFTLSAFAQPDNVPLRFQKITSDQGLPHNYVHSVTQDQKGFIWIGTNYGLARYDGYHFKTFQPDPKNPFSITHKPIGIVFADSKNLLWLTVNGGVNKMDLRTEKFSGYFFDYTGNYPLGSYFRAILEDADQQIWISSDNGLFVYDREKNHFENALEKKKFETTNNEIFYVADDGVGNIWFVIQSKLAVLNKKTREISTIGEYLANPDMDQFYYNSVASFKKGFIWMTTSANGLINLDVRSRKTDSFLNGVLNISEVYIDKQDNLYAVVNNPVYKLFIHPAQRADKSFDSFILYESDNIYQKFKIVEDRFDNVWFSSAVGLAKYHAKTGVTVYKSNTLDPYAISDDLIEHIFIDRQDNLWICPYRKGINKADLRQKPFKTHSKPIQNLDDILRDKNVSSVYTDSKNNLWFSESVNGISVCNYQTGKYYRYSINSNQPVTSIYEDDDGYLWLGTYWADLFRVKPRRISDMSETSTMTFVSSETFPIQGVRKIVKSAGNNLWFATLTGLVEYERSSGRFINHSELYDSLNDYSSFYRTIFVEDQNNIWTGSNNGGLCRYDISARSFRHFLNKPSDTTSISNNTVYAIYKDDKGCFWIGTGQGLDYFHPDKGVFRHMGLADNLNKRSVFSIIPDSNGNLWLSCDGMHIIRYNILSDRSFLYGPSDGFQNNEFNTTASFVSGNGEIFYGGSSGLISFIPSEIKPDSLHSKPVITNIRIRNALVSPGDSINGRVLIEKQLWDVNQISLRYNEAEFTIEFSALQFSTPEKIQYQYKLEGFNTDWISTGSDRRFASYTGLPPGDYVFMVRATNSDGIMCNPEDEAKLYITIIPPFWKTWWFNVMVFLVIAFVVLLYNWFRLRSLQKSNMLLNSKVRERTRELEAVNSELDQHRNKLEFLVEERTRELATALGKAEESSRLKTSFLMNMSHEIRTPMNAIIGFSSLLKEKELEEFHEEYVNIIISNGYTLLKLISDILELSSLQSLQVSLHPEQGDLCEFLKIIADTHRIEAEKKNLELRLNKNMLNHSYPLVFDEVRLTQVFSNLISNAIKFTNSGFVEFGVHTISDMLVFYVKDSGIGIEEGTGNAIFERFFKIEKNKKQLFRGTGLGLAISKNIVSLWNGDIWYESVTGKGSIFYFSHPLSFKNIQTVETHIDSEIRELNLSGKKILIAEDEESNYQLLRTYFRKTGAVIIWAKDGHEVLEILEKEKVDLVLMDIKMPGMDGMEATTVIRQKYPDLPIIAQTAYAFKNEVADILKSGITDYILKPIQKGKLFETLHKYFARKV